MKEDNLNMRKQIPIKFKVQNDDTSNKKENDSVSNFYKVLIRKWYQEKETLLKTTKISKTNSKRNSFIGNDLSFNVNSSKTNFTTNFKGQIININKPTLKPLNNDPLEIRFALQRQNVSIKTLIISSNLKPEMFYKSNNSSPKMFSQTNAKPSKENYGICNSEIVPTFGVKLNNFKNKLNLKSRLFIENPQFKGKILTLKELYPKEKNTDKNQTMKKNLTIQEKAILKGKIFEQNSPEKLRYDSFQKPWKDQSENLNDYLNSVVYNEEYIGNAKSPKPQLIRYGTSYEKKMKTVNLMKTGEISTISKTKTQEYKPNETIQYRENSKYFSFRKINYNARAKNNYFQKYYLDSKTLRPFSANRTRRAFYINLDYSKQNGMKSNQTTTSFFKI